jgi:membrane protein implicated in regulation of membrane protease activity
MAGKKKKKKKKQSNATSDISDQGKVVETSVWGRGQVKLDDFFGKTLF